MDERGIWGEIAGWLERRLDCPGFCVVAAMVVIAVMMVTLLLGVA